MHKAFCTYFAMGVVVHLMTVGVEVVVHVPQVPVKSMVQAHLVGEEVGDHHADEGEGVLSKQIIYHK